MKTIPIRAGELANKLNCKFEGDENVLIEKANTIERAGSGDLTFLANERYRKYLHDCKAGAIIALSGEKLGNDTVKIVSDNPYRDFRRAIEILYGSESAQVKEGVHKSASISENAVIGSNPRIGANVIVSEKAVLGTNCILYPGAYIGEGVVIGDDCIIGINASIRHGVIIKNRVIIGDGTVVGYDGFGYVPDANGYTRIRPVGGVEIEDDVHIGANCCIDRATVGLTRIGKGAKLDNLIQIAHGVEIGENTVIAAQAGVSGSCRIGSWVMIGGQVGFVGHIEIGDQMQIGAQAGVAKDYNLRSLITGTPARPVKELRRAEAAMSQLPELLKRVKRLEKKIEEPGS